MSGFVLAWARRGTIDGRIVERSVPALGRRCRGTKHLTRRAAADVVLLQARGTDDDGLNAELPLEEHPWVIAGDVRLDDRHRLRARLRDASCEPPAGASDARLLAAALQAWGARAADQLLGDFAFAALDRDAGALIASRGNFGVRTLFFAETKAFIACSDDLDALVALPGVDDSPDEAALMEFLRTGGPVTAQRTARAGVRRIPASETLQWEREGAPARVRHEVLPTPSRIRLVSDAEYVASFREVLDEAVADRLRGREASMLLSGGLDSPSIAASAARARPSAMRLALTISTEPLMPDRETAFARSVAQALALPHEVMPAEPAMAMAHCDDASLSTPEPVDSPQLGLWRAQVARLAAAAPLALHGEDGDAVLAPPDLLTMLRTIPWPSLVRDWLAYRTTHGRAPWSGLRGLLVPPHARRDRERASWAAPAWVSMDLVARHGERPPARRKPHRTRPKAASALRAVDWESFFAMLDPATSGAPVSFSLPMLDPRVISFVFAIPPIPWAQRKWLLRRSFQGVLPDDVLQRPKAPLRGFREALVAHWRAQGGADRALSTALRGWIDERAWRRVLRESPDAERVFEAWRVFELDRWLTQPRVG